jgi:hypothetical protein
MKYRTKVRELEAIRFDGKNRDEINALTGLQFEVVETPHNTKYLLCGGRLVLLGDWVGMEDGKLKILGNAEIHDGYEFVGQACEFDE